MIAAKGGIFDGEVERGAPRVVQTVPPCVQTQSSQAAVEADDRFRAPRAAGQTHALVHDPGPTIQTNQALGEICMPSTGTAPALAPRSITIDHTKPLTVNVASQSIHVCRYKTWKRPDAATAWADAGTGTTEDTIVDSHDLGIMPAGSSMVYWLGMGGPPKSTYKVHIVFLQDGKILNNGVSSEEGDTDAKGAAVVERKVVFP